ncbi:APC family permease [Nocardiopsis sp. MG754419]|uniref:APC family permease n=1 Tax=Nocardiopsis sp. MG754419 TaxID=2259865 RepID=UPI001BA8C3F2|nr:APC family permease [Nocardiopsis sp. MG754419]MBR8740356.1 amino acid permease [Nocardiopsis sp. MG754419]
MTQERAHRPPDPSDPLPELTAEQLATLHTVGEQWRRAAGAPQNWRVALPVDPHVGSYPARHQVHQPRYERFVTVADLGSGPQTTEASQAADMTSSPLGRAGYRARRVLLGPALKSTALVRERMRKLVALPVLSSDALSSVAYGPEAMLTILVIGGVAGLTLSLPLALAIMFMMLAVGLSYRQTIRAYPNGGGSYVVAGDNLGRMPGLLAAGGLIVDYVLTVAVSIAAGIAAITSALPALSGATVPIGLGVIALLLAGNLRGVRQAGVLFAAPTYVFVFCVGAVIVVGLVRAALAGFPPAPPPRIDAVTGVTLFLVMRAFASGATALTGIEAITNAVPVFRPVEWRNARASLTWVILTLLALFGGIMALVLVTGTIPAPGETVLSQLARHSFGTGAMYVLVQASTAAILLLAANTAYNGFPRVLSLLARDHYAPRVFTRMGDRLAYSNGILLLSVAAALIFVFFGGSTTALIPLYAVGVFLAFTLSQTGMVVHWWRSRSRHWRTSLAFNATGAVLCAAVFVTAAIAKFTSGAWVALLAVAAFVLLALRIRVHYDAVGRALRLRPHTVSLPGGNVRVIRRSPVRQTTEPWRPVEMKPVRERAEEETEEGEEETEAEEEETPEEIHHLSVVPVETLDLANIRALAYAASLQQPVLAVHLSPSEEEAERMRRYWTHWGDHLPLEVVVSPYRTIIAPLVNYIEALHEQRPGLTITVILPEVVPARLWHRLLHDRMAFRLRHALHERPKIVVTTVSFHVR